MSSTKPDSGDSVGNMDGLIVGLKLGDCALRQRRKWDQGANPTRDDFEPPLELLLDALDPLELFADFPPFKSAVYVGAVIE